MKTYLPGIYMLKLAVDRRDDDRVFQAISDFLSAMTE